VHNTIAAVGPLCLGVTCIIFGVNLRKGRGKERISRGVRVSYAKVPRAARIRASNANLAVGPAWLAFAGGVLFPGPLSFVLVAMLLLSGYPYYVRHRELHAAVKEVAKAGGAD
jgi:hypothetical protein